jgi:hypothetical protein
MIVCLSNDMRLMIGLFVLASQALPVLTASAQESAASDRPGWYKIGEVSAGATDQTGTIAVPGADKFNAIKLKVIEAPINIETATVYYESGETEEIPVAHALAKGAETRSFDLKRPAENIKKIAFTYQAVPTDGRQQALVELYGLK